MFSDTEKTFMIDRITYTVAFEHNEFSFYVVNDKSTVQEYDPFEKWGSDVGTVSYGRVKTSKIFEVKKKLTSFMSAVLSSHKPAYFRLVGTDDDKNRIYLKLGKGIAEKFDYELLQSESGERVFYKKAWL
jgi:hypothetical protein